MDRRSARRRRLVDQIGEGDQGAEELVPRLQPQQRLGAAQRDGPAGADEVHDQAPRAFDGDAHGAAMGAGMVIPIRGRQILARGEPAKVAGEGGQLAPDLRHRFAGRAILMQPPEEKGQHDRPEPAGDEHAP